MILPSLTGLVDFGDKKPTAKAVGYFQEQSQGDDGKLASYAVAGLDETNGSRPEGTMAD